MRSVLKRGVFASVVGVSVAILGWDCSQLAVGRRTRTEDGGIERCLGGWEVGRSGGAARRQLNE